MALTKIKKCQMCLSLFNATRKDAKTCSASCRKRLHRALQTRVKERAVTVERKISEDLHRLAGSFIKNFVAFEPLLLADEEGAIPVRVERRPPEPPVVAGANDGPGNVFQPSAPQTDTLQGDSLPVVEVPSDTVESIPADKTKPINLFRTKDRGENNITGQSRGNPYTSGNRVKKVFSELGNVRRRSWAVIGVVVLLLLVSGVFFNRDSDNRQISSSSADEEITTSTDELGDLFSRDGYKLSINVPLDVRKTLIITPGEQPAQLEKGQIFFDQSADALFYYDGEQLHPLGGSSTFVNNTIQGPTNITNSIVTNSTILNSIVQSGVSSVTGTGNQIIVSSNTGDVVLSLPQAIATTSTPTFSGLNLASALQVGSGGTGGTNFTANTVLLGNGSGAFQTTNAGSSGQCLVVNGSGVPTFQSCPGSGSITAGGSQTPGRLTKFDTIANQIVDSIVGELAGTVTVNGDLAVTGVVSGNGSGLTGVNAAQLGGQNGAYYTDASNISSGTLNDARLSGNVALYDAITANFTGALQQGGDDVCTVSGNCAGVGGVGDITGNGTVNRIAMFDAAKNIINSTLLQGTGSLELDSGNDFILAGGNLSVTGQSFVDYTLNTACSGCTAFGVSFTNNDGPGGSNYQSTATFGNEEGSGNTEGILDLYNNDADNIVGAAIIINNYGAGFANIINNQGVLISGAELNLLDGHDAALVDTNDAVNTAITGVGTLTAGSIGPGFGPIDTGSNPISTTGTITAGILSINSESFTDLTGTGLTNIGGVLTVDNSVLDNNFFIQGGNSFGTAAIFGTNDNQNIQLETNGSTVATLTTTGQLQLVTQGNTGGLLIGGDTNLYRGGADLLQTDDSFYIAESLQVAFNIDAGGTISTANGSGESVVLNPDGYIWLTSADPTFQTVATFIDGETNSRFNLRADGRLAWSDGSNSMDTNLYRHLSGVLVTDGEMNARSYQCSQYETADQVCVGATAPATPGAGIAFGSANDTNLYRSGTGSLKTDGQFTIGNNGGGQLNINNGNESVTQTDFTQSLNKSGINIITDFTDNSYTPGLFWSTQNNNSTRPKAGIYMFQDNANGTSLLFGTSGNYTNGLTNTALELGSLGSAKFKNGTNSATGFQVQNSSGAGLLTVNTITGATLTNSLFIDNLGSGGTTALCWNGSSQVSSCASTGSIGFWNRTGTVLQPSTAGDSVNIRSTSTTAFRVQDGAGTGNLFTVDTQNYLSNFVDSNVGIGATGNGADKLFVQSASDTVIAANSTGTNDILQLRDNGANVLTVSDTGEILSRNSADSAVALQIQNSTNDPVLTVSTTGGNYFGGVGDLQLHDQATISFGANSVVGEDINGDFHLDVYNGGLIQMSTDDAFRVQDNSGSIVVNVDTTGGGTALYVQQNDTGDLIEVTRQTDTAFLIDNDGNVLFKPVTGGDSATAFRIQNAGGQNLFVADTGNQRIAIGPASVPGNGVLTIGTNTTAASGGIYLGTDTNLYRDDSNSLRTDGDFVVGDDIEVLGDTIDIRRTSLAKENALRFTTTTGVDWKMYQSTADSNFRLWNDNANQDVLIVDGDGETRIDANSSDVLVLNNTTASGTHVYLQYELDSGELWEAGVDDTNEYFLYNDVDGQIGFTLDNQGSLLRFDNSATEALTGERYDGTEFFDFQIVDHGGEDYGQLQLGEGLPSSEISFTNDGSDRWAIGTDDSGDGNDSLYIYNYTMADYNLTIDSTGAVDINGDLEVDFSGGTSSTNGVCHTGADIDGTSSGTDRRIVPCNNSAGDIAEWYEVRGQAEAGDLLIVTDEPFTYQSTIQDPYTGITQEHKESKTISKLERSTAPYQSTIFGVISTSPVQTYGADVKYQGDNPQPIALKGRVPVKVTTENGAIRPGDKLTASSKPGYAMKATQPGYVIGTAISGLNGGEGRVEVFVDIGWDGAAQTGQTLSAASTSSNQYGTLQLVSIVAGTFIFMQLLVVFSRISRGKMTLPKIRHT